MNSHAAILHAYRLLVFACTAGFAAYDLRTRRVPDRALLLFCPVVLAAPFLNALAAGMAADPFTARNRLDCTGMALMTTHPGDAWAAGISLSRLLEALPPSLLSSLAGMATGFLILFAAAMASPGGCGVGGGDIKLAAALGFAYGPARMAAILLISSGLAAVAVLSIYHRNRHTNSRKMLSLPFVPFLAAGSLIAAIAAAL